MKSNRIITCEYADWMKQILNKSKSAFLITFLFKQKKFEGRSLINIMKLNVTSFYDSVLPIFISKKKKNGNLRYPIFFAAPDLPCARHKKKIKTEYKNNGYHMHGLICLKEELGSVDIMKTRILTEFLNIKRRTQIEAIHIHPLDELDKFPCDYLLKSIGRGGIVYDDIIILEGPSSQ